MPRTPGDHCASVGKGSHGARFALHVVRKGGLECTSAPSADVACASTPSGRPGAAPPSAKAKVFAEPHPCTWTCEADGWAPDVKWVSQRAGAGGPSLRNMRKHKLCYS